MQCSSTGLDVSITNIIQFYNETMTVSFLVRNRTNIIILIDLECIFQCDLSGYTLLWDQ